MRHPYIGLYILLFGCRTTDKGGPGAVDTAAGADTPTDAGGTDTSGTDTSGSDDGTDTSAPITDADGDGHDDVAYGGDDCDDGDAAVHPDADEACNGVDDDCDGSVDTATWYIDEDGDGYGDESVDWDVCGDPPDGAVQTGGDCDETNPAFHPGAEDACDNLWDEDCDGTPAQCAPFGVMTADDCDAVFHAPDDRGESAGWSMSPAGDVNGDGLMDVVLGAPFPRDITDFEPGRAYLVHGTTEMGGGTELEYAASLVGQHDGGYTGRGVAGLGDIDGDGYDDFAVGEPYVTPDPSMAWVVHGPITGEHDLADVADGIAVVDVAADGALLGYDLATAGDLTGDGVPDMLVEARRYDWSAPGDEEDNLFVFAGPITAGDTDAEWAAVVRETDDGLTQRTYDAGHDVNGDGVDDLLFWTWPSSSDNGWAFVMAGPLSGSFTVDDAAMVWDGDALDEQAFGQIRMLGDVDGDGLADMGIPASGSDTYVEAGGRAFLLHGVTNLDAGPLDAAATFIGADVDDNLGDFSEALDLDADGVKDIAIAGYPGGGYDWDAHGAVWVFQGPLSGTFLSTDAAGRIESAEGEYDGDSVDLGDPRNAGDMNGDGADDLVMVDRSADFLDGALYVFLGGVDGR